jgi:hypothetical protein
MGTQRILFDVTTRMQKMDVVLNSDSTVSPLIDATGSDGAPVSVPPHAVGACNKLHETPEIPVVSWPQDEVKVIRHDAVGQDAHGHLLEAQDDTTQERQIVVIGLEEPQLSGAAVHHMEGVSGTDR